MPSTWPTLDFGPPDHETILAAMPIGCTRAYEWLDVRGKSGATDSEGVMLESFSYPKRRCDLLNARDIQGVPTPLVFDSGRRRPTPRGVDAVVWVTWRWRG